MKRNIKSFGKSKKINENPLQSKKINYNQRKSSTIKESQLQSKKITLNPFLMVPRSSSDFCSNCLNRLGALFSDTLGVNRTW